jgi:hypothetical protein
MWLKKDPGKGHLLWCRDCQGNRGRRWSCGNSWEDRTQTSRACRARQRRRDCGGTPNARILDCQFHWGSFISARSRHQRVGRCMFPSFLVSRWLTDSLCGQIRDDAKSLIDVLQDPAQSSAEVCDLYTIRYTTWRSFKGPRTIDGHRTRLVHSSTRCSEDPREED